MRTKTTFQRLLKILAIAALTCHQGHAQIALTVDTDKVAGRIDPKIYGQFFEHIYHSANGGLWGDMIFNRSFEETDGSGQWSVSDGVLAHDAVATPGARINFGDIKWKNQELSFSIRLDEPGQLTVYLGVGEAGRGGVGGAASSVSADAKSTLRVVRTPVRSSGAYIRAGITYQGTPPVDGRPFDPFGLGGQGRGGAPERGLAADTDMSPQSWHAVRVRSEGTRIRWWLDDKLVGDVTDPSLPVVEGRLGIAVANAKVQLKDLKITSLNGELLMTGLPSPARHWNFYGPGGVAPDIQQPLNSKTALHLTGLEGESGILQNALLLTQSDRVRGSFWARGTASQGLVVRLLDDKKVLMEKSLPEPTTEWKEYAINFVPPATVTNASIEVGVKGKANVWVDQVSLMADSSRATGGFRPDLLKAVADLHPPIIRWPGGSFVGNYRWKDGIGPQSKRVVYPSSTWDDMDVNSLGTDEFIQLTRKVGAEPLLVINIGNRDSRNLGRAAYIQEALDWMEYVNGPADSPWGKVRATNGHPEPYSVKYWEIGNETWSMGPDAYVQAIKDFVPAMRNKYPDIKLAVCGGNGTEAGNNSNWDEILLKGDVTKLYDYLSIHHYESGDRFSEGPQTSDQHFTYLAGLVHASENPNIRFYLSEWNTINASDWRSGLYAGGLLNVIERRTDIFAMAGPALFLRHQTARAWDNAFINFDQTGWFAGGNYVVMKLWHDNFAPNLLAAEGDAKNVNLTATKSEKGDKVYLKAVNPKNEATTVKVLFTGSLKPSQAATQVVAPGSVNAKNSLAQPNVLAPMPGQASLAANTVTFTLPPLSAGVVVLNMAH